MKKIILLKTILLALTVTSALAQAPTIEWETNLGGSGLWDYAYDVRQTTDDGYIVAGHSNSVNFDVGGNNGDDDYWVVKLDSNGNIQWETNLGGSMEDQAFAIKQTTDGGYIVAGSSQSNNGDVGSNNGNSDMWVVKLNATGNIQWENNYGGSGNEEAWNIEQTTDGGYIVAGFSASSNGDVGSNNGLIDYWVVKLNSSGGIQWENNYGGSDQEWARSIKQTSDGGYIVVGFSTSSDGDVGGNNGSRDYWMVKINAAGGIQWESNYGGSSSDDAWSVKQTNDGGYIVGGYTWSYDGNVGSNNGQTDYWVIKLNNAGTLLWENNYGGSDREWAHEIQQTTDNGFIIIGASESSDGDVSTNPYTPWNNYWVVKIDNTGVIEWEKMIGGSDYEWPYAIQQTNDGGYIVAGRAWSDDGDVGDNNGGYDYWVVKLKCGPPSISSIWPRTYGGGNSPGARRFVNDLVVDEDDNVYTAGHMWKNDFSHEDPGFLFAGFHPDSFYLMKHDSGGNLAWIKYLNPEGSAGGNAYNTHFNILKLTDNNKLILLTSNDLYAFNTDGTAYFSPYQIVASAMDIDKNTGEIYLAASFPVGTTTTPDYTINGPGTGIFRFNANGTYQSHAFIQGGAMIADIEFAESQDKLFISGHTGAGATTNFAPGQSVTDAYFGAEYSTNSSPPAFLSVTNFGNNHVGLLAFDESLNHLYINRNSYTSPPNTDIYIYNGSFNSISTLIYSTSSIMASDFYFDQQENALLATFGFRDLSVNQNPEIAKIDSQGLIWNHPLLDPVCPLAIAKSPNCGNYIYVGGHYFGSTNLGTFPLLDYGAPDSWSLFTARIKDYGNSGVFEKPALSTMDFTVKESAQAFTVYPNPVHNLLYIEPVTESTAEVSLSLQSLTGREVKTLDGQMDFPVGLDINGLSNGIYILQIRNANGNKEYHKVIKK